MMHYTVSRVSGDMSHGPYEAGGLDRAWHAYLIELDATESDPMADLQITNCWACSYFCTHTQQTPRSLLGARAYLSTLEGSTTALKNPQPPLHGKYR